MEVLSPELVLVSPPEDAATTRECLELPRPVRYERPRPRLRLRAVLYGTCVIVTALPAALLLAIQR